MKSRISNRVNQLGK